MWLLLLLDVLAYFDVEDENGGKYGELVCRTANVLANPQPEGAGGTVFYLIQVLPHIARFVVTESVVILTSPRFSPHWDFFVARWVQQSQRSLTFIHDVRRQLLSDFTFFGASAFCIVCFSAFAPHSWKLCVGCENRTPNLHTQELAWHFLVLPGGGGALAV